MDLDSLRPSALTEYSGGDGEVHYGKLIVSGNNMDEQSCYSVLYIIFARFSFSK